MFFSSWTLFISMRRKSFSWSNYNLEKQNYFLFSVIFWL